MTLNVDTGEMDERLERSIRLVKELTECIEGLADVFIRMGKSLRVTSQDTSEEEK
jgi:hypothetical protein